MLISILLGQLAAGLHKEAMSRQHGRAGRRIKGKDIAKQLHAAGSAKQNTQGVFSYPRGHNVH